jgi:hypothetical protein
VTDPLVSIYKSNKTEFLQNKVVRNVINKKIHVYQFTSELWSYPPKSQFITFGKIQSYSLKLYSESQGKILNLFTVACQMCQTHHLSMQRHHNTKNTWHHPLKMHTFRKSKWEVESGKHHMWGGCTSLISPPNATSCCLIVVCVTLGWNQWQPTGYLVPVSVGLLTTLAYHSMWQCVFDLWEVGCPGLYANLVAYVKLLQTFLWLPSTRYMGEMKRQVLQSLKYEKMQAIKKKTFFYFSFQS